MSFTDYFCWNCSPKLLKLRNAQGFNDSLTHPPTCARTHFLLKNKCDDGDLHKQLQLLCAWKEEGTGAARRVTPRPLTCAFLYALVSQTHKCTQANAHVHTYMHIHTCTHTPYPLPKDGSGTRPPALLVEECSGIRSDL